MFEELIFDEKDLEENIEFAWAIGGGCGGKCLGFGCVGYASQD